jgi:hypothetical protein
MDQLSLATVSRKMREAGEHSAERFSDRHPVAYRKLGYAAIDARNRRWLRPFARQFGPHLMGIARRVDRLLQSPWIPYVLAKALVKAISAASFMYGTARIPARAADSVEAASTNSSETNPN